LGNNADMNNLPYIDDGKKPVAADNQPGDARTVFLAGGPGIAKNYVPGDIVDNVYQLTRLLGHGGMGVVFACHHQVLDKDYALKLLNGEDVTGEHWDRFKAEAKALARLNHSGIVGIHNMGVDKGQCPYFVMDLLSGETLDSVLHRSGHLSVEQSLDLFIEVADALNSAHAKGIIHRDIKPSNLMLVRDDAGRINNIKLVDFGIARVSTVGPQSQNQSQTKTGIIFGTPFYMSPEQCDGDRADARSDIYSLGCTLFEALTGSPPFCGDSTFHTFMMHQTVAPPSLSSIAPQSVFPASLEQAMQKMLAKSADDRYQTMEQVKHDFERIRDGKQIVARGMGDHYGSTFQVIKARTVGQLKAGHRERLGAISGLIFVLIVGILLIAYFAKSANKSAPPIPIVSTPVAKAPSMGQDWPDQMGATTEEVDMLMAQGPDAQKEANRFELLVKPYLADPKWLATKFKVNKPASGFRFPRQFVLGAIQIGDGVPTMARGFVPAPEGKRVCLFLPRAAADCHQLIDKFGLEDVNGLEGVFTQPAAVIPRLAKWKKLDELSFFDSLLKALPNCEAWDESDLSDADLPAIDKLSGLRSLGLCGPKVTGRAISEMALLNNLEVLKLKRVSDLGPLIKILPKFDNLKEIWLVGQNTTDDQLEFLTQMKNVETVRIRRSCLTPASLETFRKMPALQHLWLDRNTWSDEERERFRQAIPGCRFEKVVDPTFWHAVLP
jgi:serine/threonine protein kinase